MPWLLQLSGLLICWWNDALQKRLLRIETTRIIDPLLLIKLPIVVRRRDFLKGERSYHSLCCLSCNLSFGVSSLLSTWAVGNGKCCPSWQWIFLSPFYPVCFGNRQAETPSILYSLGMIHVKSCLSSLCWRWTGKEMFCPISSWQGVKSPPTKCGAGGRRVERMAHDTSKFI